MANCKYIGGFAKIPDCHTERRTVSADKKADKSVLGKTFLQQEIDSDNRNVKLKQNIFLPSSLQIKYLVRNCAEILMIKSTCTVAADVKIYSLFPEKAKIYE